MTDKRNNLTTLFARARTETPVITFNETRAHVEARSGAGLGSTALSLSITSNTIIMITTGIVVLTAALVGFLSWNSVGTGTTPQRTHGVYGNAPIAQRVQPSRVDRHADPIASTSAPVIGDEKGLLSGKEEKENNETEAEKDSNGLFRAPAPFISGVRMIELSPAQLGRLGLQIDTAGVWFFGAASNRNVGMAYQISMWGVQWPDNPEAYIKEGTIPASFEPVFVTDDFGNRRLESNNNPWERQSTIERKLQEIEKKQGRPLSDDERWQLMAELENSISEQRLITGNFIPVLVRTGRSYTNVDKTNRRWRPDCIFWYEPTPELLAALPEHVRLPLERELRLASLLQSKPDHESIEAFVERQPQEIRQAFDSLQSESVAAVAGDGLMGVFSVASGAITSSFVLPNPAHEQTTIRYTLGADRTVSFALYDIRGGLMRMLNEGGRHSAGDHSIQVNLNGVTPGMYLIVITTEKEKAMQRVIVE